MPGKKKIDTTQIFDSIPASDELSKKLIAEELHSNILVEAVPGSGKTYNLIRRLVSMVTHGNIPAGQIAAITFTRKAAEELRTRFHEKVAALLAKAATGASDRQKLQRAAVEIEDGYIGTIHGFCGSIIRQYPVEAGIDPTFREIEPEESDAMLLETWSSYLNEHPELIDLLSAYNTGSRDDKLLQSLKEISGHLDVEFPAPENKMPDVNQILDAWDKMWLEALKLRPFPDTATGDWVSEDERSYWKMLDRKNAELKKVRAEGNIYKTWQSLSYNPDFFTQKYSCNPAAAKQLKALISAFYTLFAEFDLQFCIGSYKELLGHFNAVARQAALERRQQGCLDFVDLLNETARLLKRQPGIRQAVARRFKHLLVDEFQDTDPIQAEIIFLLCDPAGSNDWRQCRPVPGSLFVVGDPKQAIYRFRRGDIDTYRTAASVLAKNSARILTLQTNRRSVPEICGWVNESFAPVFAAQQAEGQIEFASMGKFRSPEGCSSLLRLNAEFSEMQELNELKHQREIQTNPGKELKKVDLRNIQFGNIINARKITRLIREAVENGHSSLCNGRKLSPQDFLIVSRSNNVLSFIALELEKAGIPTSLSGGGNLLSERLRQDLLPLYWLMRAVSLPTDAALLYATLIGPLWGFSEADLYLHVKKYGRLSVFSDVDFTPGEEVGEALNQIRQFNAWQREFPAGTAFRRIIRHASVYAWLQTCSEGEFKIRLMNDVEKMFDANPFNQAVSVFGSWIGSWPSENRPAEAGTVNLMSVFRAKGLEAPVVIVAGFSRQEAAREPFICVTRDTEPHQAHIRIARRNGEFATRTISCSPEWTGLVNQEMKALSLEETRKDYVAATRARDCLIICSMSSEKGEIKTVLRKEMKEYVAALPVIDSVGCASEAVQVKKAGRGRSKKAPDYSAMYKEFCEAIENCRQKASQPSCESISVTELAEPADKSVFARNSDRGTGYGLAMHQVLDTAMRHGLSKERNMASELAGLFAHAAGEDAALALKKDELLKEAMGAIAHPIWYEACSASTCLTEVPVASLEADAKRLPVKSEVSGALRLNGTIDLVYRFKDGWKIVDYKTDLVNDDRHLQQLADYHAPQLKLYAHLWEKLTGEKVLERQLLFVNCGCAVSR